MEFDKDWAESIGDLPVPPKDFLDSLKNSTSVLEKGKQEKSERKKKKKKKNRKREKGEVDSFIRDNNIHLQHRVKKWINLI